MTTTQTPAARLLAQVESDERLAEAATPGPWASDGMANPWKPSQRSPFADQGASIETMCDVEDRHWPGEKTIVVGGVQGEQGGAVGVLYNEDAKFIAASRSIVPRQAAQMRALIEALQEIAVLPVFHDEDGLTINIGVCAQEALEAAAAMMSGDADDAA